MEDLLMKSVNKHYFSEKERKELAKEGAKPCQMVLFLFVTNKT